MNGATHPLHRARTKHAPCCTTDETALDGTLRQVWRRRRGSGMPLIRKDIAKKELESHEAQIENAVEIDEFFRDA